MSSGYLRSSLSGLEAEEEEAPQNEHDEVEDPENDQGEEEIKPDEVQPGADDDGAAGAEGLFAGEADEDSDVDPVDGGKAVDTSPSVAEPSFLPAEPAPGKATSQECFNLVQLLQDSETFMRREETVTLPDEVAANLARNPTAFSEDEDPAEKAIRQLRWIPTASSQSDCRLTTLSGVFRELDTRAEAERTLGPTINLIYHLLVYLRIGKGKGCDSKVLPNPWKLRRPDAEMAGLIRTSMNWQQKLDHEIGLLNARTTMPTYRQSRLEGLAQIKSFRDSVKAGANVEIPDFPKLQPGQTVLMVHGGAWLVGRLFTVWRSASRSYPSVHPLDIVEAGQLRISVLKPKTNLC